MANYSKSRQSFPPIRSQKSRRNPASPLKHPRHEAFARSFAERPNAKSAGQAAGYPRHIAMRAAGRLLSVTAMTERIQYLQNKDAETLTLTKLVQELYFKPKAALTKAVAINPFTGEVGLDLARLGPDEIASLDLIGSLGGLGLGPKLKVQSSPGKALAGLGRLVNEPAYAPDRKERSSFAAALEELAQRNSNAAPMHSNRRRSDFK